MEVFGTSKLLSNWEVYTILKEVKCKKKHNEEKNVATIAYETNKYLESTSCIFQNEDCIETFLNAIKNKGFRLTKGEKLLILNQRPITLVELQLLIEENEERFSEEALEEILVLVKLILPEKQSIENVDNCV